jgi:hypothetical protein
MPSDTVKVEEATQRPWMDRHTLSFHLGIPTVLGLMFGFSQSGSEPLHGVSGHLAYWLISTIISWQLLAIRSKAASAALRPLKVPLVIVLLLGFAIGIALWAPVSGVRDMLIGGFVIEGETLQGYSRYSDISRSIGNWILGASLWLSTNYFYLYVLGAPRYGYKPDSTQLKKFRDWFLSFSYDDLQLDDTLPKTIQTDTANPLRQPRLLERLKAGQSAKVLALVAEDHYTRVLMQDHDELIYLRFSDAVRDMDEYPGLQVHRSYWVGLSAVQSYKEQGHRAFLTLTNGTSVPVSRSFRRAVRDALT